MALISSGALNPCQSARLYSGCMPSVPFTIAASTGPMVQLGATPTARHTTTRTSTGTRSQRGGSCGVRVSPTGGPLKYTSWMKRMLYATASAAAIVATTGTSHSIRCDASRSIVSAKNISLDRKPFSSGTPAIARRRHHRQRSR